MKENKKLLLRWCGWFFTGNAFLLWIFGAKYLTTVSWLNTGYLTFTQKIVGAVFVALSYIGQLSLVAFLPCVFIVPIILLFPRHRTVFTLSILSAVFIAAWIIIDSIVYGLYRFHLNGALIPLIFSGAGKNFFGFAGTEYFTVLLVFLGILALEIVLAFGLWRRISQQKKIYFSGYSIAIFLSLCLYTSYASIFFSANRLMNHVFIDEIRILPFYTEILGALISRDQGALGLQRLNELYLLQPKQFSAPLNYPIKPLVCSPSPKPLNVVMIAIDSWRFDSLNPAVTPSIESFSKRSWIFKHHLSGGNATGPGIFTLFYGIPSTYWTAMEEQHRGPVFLRELLSRHYEVGVYSGYPFSVPPFDRTVFFDIKNLQKDHQSEKTPYARDRVVTKKFKEFIVNVSETKKPFFSFLFYSAAHSYCEGDDDLKPLQPTIKRCNRFAISSKTDPLPYLNRYKNSLLFIDEEIRQVIALLESRHLLSNTVVIITGDHGEEFNDNRLDYWGHASNFTRYQTQTPLVVYWPGEPPKIFTHDTTHFDIVPTLMERVAGCRNSSKDYSVGVSLLDKKARPYTIIGSYIDFGIIEPSEITTIFPDGHLEFDDPQGKSRGRTGLNLSTMQQVFVDLRRFYRA